MLKKIAYIAIGSLVYSISTFAVELKEVKNENTNFNYELKLGITPYKRYGRETYSERFSNGFDYGVEIYKDENSYSSGFGGEIKRKMDSEYLSSNEGRLYTYYLLGKKKLPWNYSIVGRAGGTVQKEYDPYPYIALGIEKKFNKINIQLLGEATKLKNELNNRYYGVISLKVGYIFGEKNISKIKLKEPLEVLEKIDVESQEKLVINDFKISSGYKAYRIEVPLESKEKIKEIVEKLNIFGKNGILEIRCYSDITGKHSLNVEIANKRMDEVEKELINNKLQNGVRIRKIDPNMTVKKDYIVNNEILEHREQNRRIEVTFIES